MPEADSPGKQKAMSPVTVYDVAREAGVSITTISRALDAPDKMEPATLQRVRCAMDEFGCAPKAEAAARARKTLGRIGVLAPFFTYPSFVQLLRSAAGALAQTVEFSRPPFSSIRTDDRAAAHGGR